MQHAFTSNNLSSTKIDFEELKRIAKTIEEKRKSMPTVIITTNAIWGFVKKHVSETRQVEATETYLRDLCGLPVELYDTETECLERARKCCPGERPWVVLQHHKGLPSHETPQVPMLNYRYYSEEIQDKARDWPMARLRPR